MPFIGNQPALAYTSFAVQHFTTSATTSYTLDYPVANENEIRLVINNVVQQPGSSYAYSATGTSLTLTSATTATDTMYAVFLGKAVQTVNPPASSITNSMIASNAAIALTKLASTGTLTVDNIQFPATQVASANANNLDDYEEGTFTPTILGTTTAGTFTPNATYTFGTYTKIGRIVNINFSLVYSSFTGTGNIKLGGLPFANNSVFNANSFTILSNSLTKPANTNILGYIEVNEIECRLITQSTSGTNGDSTALAVDAAAEIYFNFTYSV